MPKNMLMKKNLGQTNRKNKKKQEERRKCFARVFILIIQLVGFNVKLEADNDEMTRIHTYAC